MPEAKTFGRYEVVRRLAIGGMAEVLLARVSGAAGFERELVIKRILPQFSQSQEFVESFRNEAKISTPLLHPNIVQVYELSVLQGEYLLAMEYVRGFDLGVVMDAAFATGGRVPIAVSLRIALDWLEGLHFAHEARDDEGRALCVVHRDVTPSNILVSEQGVTKVADFGIAKATASTASRRTATGTLKGKCAYIAPEQIVGGGKLDRRADIFASGVVLYELLAGENPFRTESDYATLSNVVEKSPLSLRALRPEVSPALAALVARAIAKDPGERYPSAELMLSDLEAAARELQVVPRHAEVADYLRSQADALVGAAAEAGAEEQTVVDTHVQGAFGPTRFLRRGLAITGAALLVGVVLLIALWPKPPAFVQPRPLPPSATVELRSEPSGLQVLINGVVVTGTTPLDLAYEPPTRLDIQWLVGGRPSAAERLDVTAAQIYRLNYRAGEMAKPAKVRASPPAEHADSEAGSGTGRLRIIVAPWAVVWVDGKRVGETPFDPIELTVGFHSVRLENPDLRHSREHKVKVTARALTVLRDDLTD